MLKIQCLLLLLFCFASATSPINGKYYLHQFDGNLFNAATHLKESNATLVIDQDATVLGDTEFNRVTLEFDGEHTITVPDEKKLVFTLSTIRADAYRIFNCEGTGYVLGNYCQNKEVMPNWWGAQTASDTTYDLIQTTKAFESAVYFAKTGHTNIFIPAGRYYLKRVDLTINLGKVDKPTNCEGLIIRGSGVNPGTGRTELFAASDTPLFSFFSFNDIANENTENHDDTTVARGSRCIIRDLVLEAYNSNNYTNGLYMMGSADNTIQNVEINNFKVNLSIKSSWINRFIDLRILNHDSIGVNLTPPSLNALHFERVRNSTSKEHAEANWNFQNPSSVSLTGCTSEGEAKVGVAFPYGARLVLNNCHFEKTGTQILYGNANYIPRNLIVSNCFFWKPTGMFIDNGSQGEMDAISIENCWFKAKENESSPYEENCLLDLDAKSVICASTNRYIGMNDKPIQHPFEYPISFASPGSNKYSGTRHYVSKDIMSTTDAKRTVVIPLNTEFTMKISQRLNSDNVRTEYYTGFVDQHGNIRYKMTDTFGTYGFDLGITLAYDSGTNKVLVTGTMATYFSIKVDYSATRYAELN